MWLILTAFEARKKSCMSFQNRPEYLFLEGFISAKGMSLEKHL